MLIERDVALRPVLPSRTQSNKWFLSFKAHRSIAQRELVVRAFYTSNKVLKAWRLGPQSRDCAQYQA